jgi:mRNA interferase YafQ
MLRVSYSKQFQRDVKRLSRRGKNMSKLRELLELLIEAKPLDARYRNHKLQGEFRDRRECHLEFDWVLIYKRTEEEIIFERTGTHSDLFE